MMLFWKESPIAKRQITFCIVDLFVDDTAHIRVILSTSTLCIITFCLL